MRRGRSTREVPIVEQLQASVRAKELVVARHFPINDETAELNPVPTLRGQRYYHSFHGAPSEAKTAALFAKVSAFMSCAPPCMHSHCARCALWPRCRRRLPTAPGQPRARALAV